MGVGESLLARRDVPGELSMDEPLSFKDDREDLGDLVDIDGELSLRFVVSGGTFCFSLSDGFFLSGSGIAGSDKDLVTPPWDSCISSNVELQR